MMVRVIVVMVRVIVVMVRVIDVMVRVMRCIHVHVCEENIGGFWHVT